MSPKTPEIQRYGISWRRGLIEPSNIGKWVKLEDHKAHVEELDKELTETKHWWDQARKWNKTLSSDNLVLKKRVEELKTHRDSLQSELKIFRDAATKRVEMLEKAIETAMSQMCRPDQPYAANRGWRILHDALQATSSGEKLSDVLPKEDHACSTGDCDHFSKDQCDTRLKCDYPDDDAQSAFDEKAARG